MTVSEIEERVARIRGHAEDDAEAAHTFEDQLHFDVLEAIAWGTCDDPQAAAAAAIATADIAFSRGCS